MTANFKFLPSGSILNLNSNRCPERLGNGIRLGFFYSECGAINAMTQTFWGVLFFSRYNKCMAGPRAMRLVSCKNGEDQRFNFGK